MSSAAAPPPPQPHVRILLAAALAVTDLEMMEPVEKLEAAEDNNKNTQTTKKDEDETVEEAGEEIVGEPSQIDASENDSEEEKEDDIGNTGEGNDDEYDASDENGNADDDDDGENPAAEETPMEVEEQGGQKLGDLLNDEVFEGEEFQKVDYSQYGKVTIAIGTEWIKCACGNLKFGVRFGGPSGGGSSDADDSVCLTWDFFGGTDTDRSHVGDTYFWQAVQEAAPTVTSQQWTEYVQGHEILVVEEKDEEDEEDEDDEEDDYRPQAAYPDIFKSVLLLAVANQVLEGGLQFTIDGMSLSPACAWELLEQKSVQPIESFGQDLHGNTWTRKTTTQKR